MRLCPAHSLFCCESCKVPTLRPMHEFADVARASAMDDFCNALSVPTDRREDVADAFIRITDLLPIEED